MKKEYLDRIKIIEYKDEKKNYLMNVFTYIPESNIENMKIVFVMSGCLRDALNYLKLWIGVANENNIKNEGYTIFGHSSGSQFAHRFMMFGNSKYCKLFLCANAGLYTFYDDTKDYPYGIKNLKKYHKRILETLTKKVYILAGEEDLKSDLLNNLPRDIEEGINRYERANNYFSSAKEMAEKNKIKFNWKFVSMPKVHHNSEEVIPFATNIINQNLI